MAAAWRRPAADAVIDASGTWSTRQTLPASTALQAIGEAENADRIAYGMPDVLGRERERYAGKTVAILGAGHSAVGTHPRFGQAEEAVPATEIVWILRGDNPEKTFGGGPNDKLVARGELGKVCSRNWSARVASASKPASADADHGRADKLRLGAGSACCGRHVEADELIVATGFRPDLSFLRELRLALDPALECPPIGPPDRSQPAQLWHRASPWRARAGAARSRLLLRRHEILRPRADLPDDDRLRAGALDCGGHRRRQGRG